MKRFTIRHLFVIIAMCGLCGASVGICTNTAGLFYTSISDDLGIGQGAVSLTLTILSITSAAAGLFVASIIKNEMMLKPMIAASILMMAGGTWLLAVSDNLWMIYLWNVIRGVGAGLAGFVTSTIVINRWFYARHGFFVSLAMCFSGIPGVLLSNFFTSVIQADGWREGYIVVAIVILAFTLPSLVLPFTLDPFKCGTKPYGYEEYEALKESNPEKMVLERKDHGLPAMALVIFIIYTSAAAINSCLLQHLPNYAVFSGNAAALGAMMVAVVNGANVIAKLSFGMLSDRVGTMKSSLLMATLSTTGIALMAFLPLPAALVAGAALYGCTMPNSAIALSLITSDIFGMGDYNRIYPVISFICSTVYAIAVALMGTLFDISGSYLPVFALCLVMQLLVFVTVKVLYGRYAAKSVR